MFIACSFHFGTYTLISAPILFVVLDFIKFICGNDVSHEYEEPSNVNKVSSSFIAVSEVIGTEFYSARIIFTALLPTDSVSLIDLFISFACNFLIM